MATEDPVKAMVLAAGVGSRLDPLTRTTPKPLVPIANRPVMEHILRLLKHHNIVDVISNLHHLPEKIPAYFGNGERAGVKATFREEQQLSGDAGGVRFCRDFLDGGTFIVIMGDLITDADLTYVIEQHRAKGAIASIALQRVADVSHFGVAVLDDDCFIKGFQEKPKPEEAISNLASTGIYVLEPEVFDHVPPTGEYGFGRQLFPSLVNLGLPVLGVQVFGYWSDIGTIDMYRRSSFDALNGLIDLEMPGVPCEHGWLGEGAEIASDCSIDGLVLIGKNTVIESGVELKGHVIIGDNCHIARGSKISESIIWSNTRIGEQALVADSIVGDNCDIGAGAELTGGKVTVESVPAVRHKVIKHSAEPCSALSH
ncbi:MAG TPA: NDP-sugar synthase [Chroococcales cyanobacterium]